MVAEEHKCKNSDFVITNTLNWLAPKPSDPCWGYKCKICGGVIATGFTRSQLRK